MNLNFLSGKSQLAALMREKDWSLNPLGNPESWPQSLKSIVGVMLSNRFPMYIVWGADFIQLYNDAYLSILGSERHPAALGERSEVTWPDIWQTIGPMYRKVYETGESIGFDDYKLPRMRNGVLQDAYYSFSYNPIYDEAGAVAGIAVICEETTERILSLLSLKDHIAKESFARARFEAIFQGSATALVFLSGPELVYKLLNDSYQKLVPNRALINKPLLEALPELKGTAFPKHLMEVYESGITKILHEELAPLLNVKTGLIEDRFFDSAVSRIQEVDGTFGVLVQATEVTERVQSKKLLEKLLEKNKETAEEIESILEGMSDAFITVGKDWIVQRINNQFEKVIQKKRGEVIGKNLMELFFNSPEQQESLYVKSYRKVMKERVPVFFVDYYEPYNIWTAVNAYPTSKGMAVFFREISEEKKAAQRLQDAITARDTFLSIASHELRTPLTSMKMQIQLLEKNLLKNANASVPVEPVLKTAAQIGKGLNRMNRLVEDMLDISRIQIGKLQLEFAKTEMVSFIKELSDRFSEQFSKANIRISIDTDRPQFILDVDQFRMEQVFTNLMTNAIRYAPNSNVEISLKESEQNFLTIIFQDSGPGVKDKDLERVFDRFERLVSAHEVSGLGLGLFIVREIILGHGGTIRLESRTPHGARFVIRLPFVQTSKTD